MPRRARLSQESNACWRKKLCGRAISAATQTPTLAARRSPRQSPNVASGPIIASLIRRTGMLPFTALVTLLATIFYFYLGLRVGAARGKFGVKAPATTGHPDFERAFRVQMNTLEWMPIVLPALWLFAVYISDRTAAAIGAVWIIGRIVYFIGYSQAAAKRGPGFLIQGVAAIALWAGAL